MNKNIVLAIGTKIHYTGDIANDAGEGEITAIHASKWYGHVFDVTLNDGRVCAGLTAGSFGPLRPGNCSDRFQVIDT
jgi:hypothetical protein